MTVILNVFRRGQNLSRQVASIKAQTYPVSEFLVWENGEDTSSQPAAKNYHVSRASKNFGVWARFGYALNAKSDFIWVIDDDTIPGTEWLENAINTFQSHPGVIGSRGLRFRSKNAYLSYEEFGPNFPNEEVQEVDILGHNWIFPREWLGAFWGEYEFAYGSDVAGEDIHLSYAVQKRYGLGSFVPPHPAQRPELWGEIRELSDGDGSDSPAISMSPQASRRFEMAYRHYLKIGFSILAEKGQTSVSKLQSGGYLLASRMPNLAHYLAGRFSIKK